VAEPVTAAGDTVASGVEVVGVGEVVVVVMGGGVAGGWNTEVVVTIDI
jgi:hypothetical protein